MKLLVISHTEHYYDAENKLVGWGPTVTELNHLLSIFEEIYHMAVLSGKEPAPKSALPYISNKIHFIPLKKVGGNSLKDKCKILLQIPDVLYKVQKTLKEVDYFQLRTPTAMGTYLIPYLLLVGNKKGWFKYAGNWVQNNPPISYAFQRWMLQKQRSFKVTINGEWENQPKQCITFENPCLTQENREEGKNTIPHKVNIGKINFCYVGTFNVEKGIDKILAAIEEYSHSKLGSFYFVGDGELKEYCCTRTGEFKINVIFKGFLPKEEINEIYKLCHFIVLPSENEGFPKVIGEAMNYGCIPIVSNVSCIGQYITNKKNGFLIVPLSSEKLRAIIEECIIMDADFFKEMIETNFSLSEKFTYANYNKQLKSKILDLE